MTLKVLLNVVGTGQSNRDIERAIDVCLESNAHLSVLIVTLASPPPVGEYAVAMTDTWVQEKQQAIARMTARQKEIDALLARSDIGSDCDTLYCEQVWAEEAIGERARFADMTMIGPELLRRDSEVKSRAIEGALFESARPIVVMPEQGPSSLKAKTVIIAWDGRVEVARAVFAALDIMKSADKVHIVMVDPEPVMGGDGRRSEPGADIAVYLARHDINVSVDHVASAGQSTAEVLNERARDLDAGLIVMGGYGHSRLRERIFGGVTRSMLDDARVPVLMAR